MSVKRRNLFLGDSACVTSPYTALFR